MRPCFSSKSPRNPGAPGRLALIVILFHFHQIVLAITSRALLNRPETFFDLHLLVASLIGDGLGVLRFALLDRLRRPV